MIISYGDPTIPISKSGVLRPLNPQDWCLWNKPPSLWGWASDVFVIKYEIHLVAIRHGLWVDAVRSVKFRPRVLDGRSGVSLHKGLGHITAQEEADDDGASVHGPSQTQALSRGTVDTLQLLCVRTSGTEHHVVPRKRKCPAQHRTNSYLCKNVQSISEWSRFS